MTQNAVKTVKYVVLPQEDHVVVVSQTEEGKADFQITIYDKPENFQQGAFSLANLGVPKFSINSAAKGFLLLPSFLREAFYPILKAVQLSAVQDSFIIVFGEISVRPCRAC